MTLNVGRHPDGIKNKKGKAFGKSNYYTSKAHREVKNYNRRNRRMTRNDIKLQEILVEREKLALLKDLRDGNIKDDEYRRELINSGIGDINRLWRTNYVKCLNPEAITKELFEDAIERAHGVKGVVARLLGISRYMVNKLEKEFKIRAKFTEERESMIDLAECRLFESANYGEEWAIKLILTTIGKKRGYTKDVNPSDNKGAILDALDKMLEMDEEEMIEYDEHFGGC